MLASKNTKKWTDSEDQGKRSRHVIYNMIFDGHINWPASH